MADERNQNLNELAVSGGEMPVGFPAKEGVARSTYEALEDLLQPRGPSLKDFLTLLLKRKKIVIATALAIFLAGFIYAFTTPDRFTATATLEIRGYSPVLGQGGFETLLQTDTRKILYQTTTIAKLTHLGLVDDVLNTDKLGEAVQKYFRKQRSRWFRAKKFIQGKIFGMKVGENQLDEEDPRYVHHQNFLQNYLKLLQINPVHETSLVQVRATTTDRRLSQRIANAHAEGLIRHLSAERRAELGEHVDTLKKHADELQRKLADAESDVARYAKQNQLVGLTDGAQGNLMLSHLTELNKLLAAAQAQRFQAESKVKEAGGKKRKEDSSFLDDETVKDLRTKLKEAESEYAALSQLVTSEYPKLVELRGKIDSLKTTILEERKGNLSALKTQYDSNLAAEKLLVQQFEDQLKKAQEISNQLVQYNLLQREAGSLRDLTQAVLKSLNETQISATTTDKSNVSISDYAPLPRVPSAPRRNIILVFSLVLGVIAGIGLAILRELLDGTIKVSDEAQTALGVPTLGIIPSFKSVGESCLVDEREQSIVSKIAGYLPFLPSSGADKKTGSAAASEKPREGESAKSIEAGAGTSSEVPLRVLSAEALPLPEAGVLDALRTLRANILFSSTQNVSRVIMVASGREREGKTSVISNLAVTFARASQRTLLIDGDLRRPRLCRRFGISKEQLGLVDFLAGQAKLEEIAVPSAVPNLMIIPAGSPTLNPTELLGSEKMGKLIATLRDEFDVILLDSAPVLPVADSLMLAQFAETVIFVVRSGRTEKTAAQEAVRRLRRVGARIRGVVLNDFDPGEGSYSSDRYSVSRYTIVEPMRRSGADPGRGHDPDEQRRAVG